MSSIDERVVQMTFDNKKFERDVRTTMSTLDDFKKKLDFSKSTRALKELQQASDGVRFSALEQGVDALQKRFSVLGETIHGIEMQIVNFGKRQLKMLTVDQLSAGMQKYEDVMNATRTIMNATGKTAEDVDSVMQNLMKYSDETSYSFSQMSGYIASFASSGAIKDLDQAERVMEGIANAAAHAGIGINQAAWPMQTLVKAFSNGKMEGQQWDSLVLSKFVTPKLRQEIIASAKALGKLDKAGNVVTESGKKIAVTANTIDSTLRYGWMTSDVMADAFGKYYFKEGAEGMTELGKAAFKSAQEAKTFTDVIDTLKDVVSTGWMTSFKTIIGNVDEASQFFTRMVNAFVDMIAPISEARNEILEGWRDLGGRMDLMQGLHNMWVDITKVVEICADAFKNTFGVITSGDLAGITKNFEAFTRGIYKWLMGNGAKAGEKIAPRFVLIRMALQGLLTVIRTVGDVIKGAWSVVSRVIETLFPSTDSFLVSIGKLGHSVSEFLDQLRDSGEIQKFFDGIFEAIKPFVEQIPGFVTAVGNFFGTIFGLFAKSQGAEDGASWLKTTWESIKTTLGDMAAKGTAILGRITKIFTWLGDSKSLEEVGHKLTLLWTVIKVTLSETFDKIKAWLSDKLSKAGKLITDNWPAIADAISSVFNTVKDWVVERFKDLGKILSDNWPVIADALRGFFENVSAKAADIWSAAKTWIKNAIKDAGQWIKDNWPLIVKGIKGMFQEVRNRAVDIWGKLVAWIRKTYPTVKQAIVDWFDNFFNSFPEIWEKVKKKIDDVFKSIREFFGKKADVVKEVIPDVAKTGANGGGNPINEMLEAITPDKETVSNAKTVFEMLGDVFGFIGTVFNWLTENPLMAFMAGLVTSAVMVARPIASIFKSMDEIKNGYKKRSGFSAIMQDIAVSFSAVSASLALIAQIPAEKLAAGGGVVLRELAIMSAIIVGLSLLDKKIKGLNMKNMMRTVSKLGFSLLAFSGSLLLMYPTILLFSNMDWDVYFGGLMKVGLLMLAIGVTLGLASRIAGTKVADSAKTFLGLAGGIAILALSLRLLWATFEGVDFYGPGWEKSWTKLAAMIVAVGVIAVALGGAARLAGNTKKLGGTFVAMAVAIGVLGLVFTSIFNAIHNTGDVGALIGTIVALGGIFAILAWLIKEAGKVNATSIDRLKGVILATAAMLLVYSNAFVTIKDIPTDKIVAFGASIAAFEGMLAVVVKASQGSTWEGAKNALVSGLGIAALAVAVSYALQNIAEVPTDKIYAFAVALVTAVAGVAALGWVGSTFGASAGLIISFCAAIAAGVVLLGLAAGIVAAIGTQAIEAFSGALFGLSTALQDFSNVSAELNKENIDLALGVTGDILAKVVEMVGVDYSGVKDFSTQTYRLGVAIRNFSNMAKQTDPEKSKQALTIVNDIKSAAESINSIPDVKDLSTVITDMGGAIRLYYSNLGMISNPVDENGNPIDTSNVDTKGIAQMFADLAADMPVSEDIQKIAGFADKDTSGLGNLATGITNLSTSLTTFGTDMGNVKKEDIDKGIVALGEFANIKAALPGNEDVRAFFGFPAGSKEGLDQFAADIGALGQSLDDFATGVGGEDRQAQVTSGLASVTALAGIQNELPKIGGIKQWFEGVGSLDNFANGISSLGRGLNNFAKAISKDNVAYDEATMTSAISVVTALAGVQTELSPTGGLIGILGGNKSLGEFANNLGAVGTGINSFMVNLKAGGTTYDESILKMATAVLDVFTRFDTTFSIYAVRELSGELSTLGDDLGFFFSSLYEALPKDTKFDGSKLAEMVNSVSVFVSELATVMNTLGENVDLNIQNGILENADDTINAAIEEVMLGALDKGADAIDTWAKGRDVSVVGGNVAMGFANGVRTNAFQMSDAITEMSQAAEKRFRDYWGIESPSTLGFDLAGFLGQGLNLGFLDSAQGLLDTVSSVLGGDLGNVVQSALGGVGEIFNGGFDGILEKVKGSLGDMFVEGMTGDEISSWFSSLFGDDELALDVTLNPDTSKVTEALSSLGTGVSTGGSSGRRVGGGGGSSSLSGSDTASLGKITSSVSSGGLLLSATEGYTIGDILTRIDRLENAITHMQLVLDTGVVAGGVAYGVDQQLGLQTSLEERWN